MKLPFEFNAGSYNYTDSDLPSLIPHFYILIMQLSKIYFSEFLNKFINNLIIQLL